MCILDFGGKVCRGSCGSGGIWVEFILLYCIFVVKEGIYLVVGLFIMKYGVII